MNTNYSSKYHFSSQYFGSIVMYFLLLKGNDIVIEQHETYQKRSLRNRMQILGPNQAMNLSVPLKTGKTKSQIKKVGIAYENHWIEQHLSTLESNYGNAAFFDYYYPEIESMLKKKHPHLWDLNIETMNWVISKLALENNFSYSDQFIVKPAHDLRNQSTEASKILEGHIEKNLSYCQVYEYKYGFSYVSSILDLLFCTGPEALNYLSSIPDFEMNSESK